MKKRFRGCLPAIVSSPVIACLLPLNTYATTLFEQNFNDPAFVGSLRVPAGGFGSSDRIGWELTRYTNINNVDGWTFTGDAAVATQEPSGDGALLLNEGGASATVKLSGFVIGQQYQVSFLQWGDNEPGGSYDGSVSIDRQNIIDYSGVDGTAGTRVAATQSADFMATKSNLTFLFRQSNSTGGASPIIDDVEISSNTTQNPIYPTTGGSGGVPEPSSWVMLLLGFGGIGLTMRRRVGRAA